MRLTTMQLGRLTTLLLVIVFLGERVGLTLPTPDAASAKHQIEARGVGKGVKVHEADGAVLSGKIVSLNDDSFGIQVGSKPSVEIAYADVRAVDKPGLSTGAKIGIGVGIGVAVSAAVIAIYIGHQVGKGIPALF